MAVCVCCGIAACKNSDETTECTVTLDANYEGGGKVDVAVEKGSSFSEPDPSDDRFVSLYARAGMTIVCWTRDSSGKQPVTFPVQISENVTFYASWETAQTYTLHFIKNGASEGEAPADMVVQGGTTVTLPSGEGLKRDGYLFKGWRDQNGKQYAPEASYVVTTEMTFAPIWARAAEVTFSISGGTGEVPSSFQAEENSEIVLPSASISKTNYTFDGWLFEGELYAAGDSFNVGERDEIAFTAAWNGTYGVSFDPEIAGAVSSGKTGENITLPAAPTDEGSDFTGWQWNGKSYPASGSFTMGYEDVSFVAAWKQRGYAVEWYDGQNGSKITETFFQEGVTASAPEDVFVASLSEFDGWRDTSGTPVELADISSDCKLYAHYSVAFCDGEAFTYTHNTRAKTYTISGRSSRFNTLGAAVNLPAFYRGEPVVGIANASSHLQAVFYNVTSLQKVRIPSNWTSIGNYAFYNCSLAEIEFAENGKLSSVGASAFSGSGLTSLHVPDSVTTIGVSAFSGCEGLVTVEFGEDSGVTAFSDGTENHRSSIFANCSALTDVTLPGKLTVIGLTTFQYCPIETITMPASLRIIGQSAFNYCNELKNVVFPADSQLEEIRRTAFGWCRGLQNIKLPDTVKTLAYNSFTTCERLESVEFGNVETIGDSAFFRCYALKRVNSAEDGVFNLPSTLQSIGEGAFAQCSQMKTVNFGEHSELKTVGMYAFAANLYHDMAHYEEPNTGLQYNYESVEMALSSVTFPASIAKIGKFVFYHDFNLKTLGIEGESTAYYADGQGIYDKTQKRLIAYALGSETTSYTLWEDCVAMDEYIFAGNMKDNVSLGAPTLQTLTVSQNLGAMPYAGSVYAVNLKTVVVPEGSKLESIDEAAFAYATALDTFDLGKATGLVSIGVESFEATKLREITLPASLTSIGNFAFVKTTELVSVNFAAGSTLKSIGYGAFQGSDSAKDPNNLQEGIVGSKLSSFTLPASVEEIGEQAFAFTTSLTTFTFGEGSTLSAIPKNMFRHSGVRSLTNIPETMSSLGEGAFSYTSNLQEVNFQNIEEMGWDVFTAAKALRTAVVKGSYVATPLRLFSDCTALTSVTLGDSVQNIFNDTFSGCTNLQELELPASVTSIGDRVFRNCTSLKKLTLPSPTVITLSTSAFILDVGGTHTVQTLCVPANLVDDYRLNANWKQACATVQAIA